MSDTQTVLTELKGFEEDITKRFDKQADRIGQLEVELKKAGIDNFGAPITGTAAVRKAIDAFTSSDQFKALQAGSTRQIAVEVKAICKDLTSLQGSPGSPPTGYPVHPERDPGLAQVMRPLHLLDALPSRPTSSNTVSFVRLNGYASAADTQGHEGATKAEQSVDPQLNEAAIETIAVHIPVSKQVLADVGELQDELQRLLVHGVRAKAESQLVNGAGGQARILGLVPQATTFVHTPGMPAVDRIGSAIALMNASGYQPNLIVLPPSNWFNFISERASGGNEQYIGPGWSVPANQSVYQAPVVISPTLQANRALVIDTNFVRVADREQATISAGYTGDGFVRNVITLLAEVRLGIIVRDPAAVTLIDLTDGGSP